MNETNSVSSASAYRIISIVVFLLNLIIPLIIAGYFYNRDILNPASNPRILSPSQAIPSYTKFISDFLVAISLVSLFLAPLTLTGALVMMIKKTYKIINIISIIISILLLLTFFWTAANFA
jgi:hypothetical protein